MSSLIAPSGGIEKVAFLDAGSIAETNSLDIEFDFTPYEWLKIVAGLALKDTVAGNSNLANFTFWDSGISYSGSTLANSGATLSSLMHSTSYLLGFLPIRTSHLTQLGSVLEMDILFVNSVHNYTFVRHTLQTPNSAVTVSQGGYGAGNITGVQNAIGVRFKTGSAAVWNTYSEIAIYGMLKGYMEN